MTLATTPCPIKPTPCPLNELRCPVKDAPTQQEYPKVLTRAKGVIDYRLHKLIVNELPLNTVPSPGGSFFYQKLTRVSRVYWDIKGEFEVCGQSRFFPKDDPETTALLWQAWGVFRTGRTFNLPTATRLNSIVLIATLVKLGWLNAIYSVAPQGSHLVGQYHNFHLFTEMPYALENGNEWDEKRKRWVPGKPKPSWLCHIWIREGSGYRRTTNTPTEVTFRWVGTNAYQEVGGTPG